MSDTRPIAERFNRHNPCPVCASSSKGCSRTDDGLHLCRGEAQAGWKLVKRGDEFSHYRGEEDRSRLNWQPPPSPPKPTARNWLAEAERYAADLTPALQVELARSLGLPVGSLESIRLLGYVADTQAPAWTMPECDGAGRVVGINRRFREPQIINGGKPTTKAVLSGSRRGLTIPQGWNQRPGPVFVVEGATDVAALWQVGLCVVGRPAAMVGAEALATLFKDLDANRPIIVLAENDAKADGKWPGKEGAEHIAGKLSAALQRPVKVAFPPAGMKDAREWAKGLAAEKDWLDAGLEIARRTEQTAVEVDNRNDIPARDAFDSGIRLDALILADLPPPKFVIEDLLPEGLSILAGRPKLGKSWLATLKAICTASGLNWLGGVVSGTRDVLHLALEDTRRRYRDRASKMLRGLRIAPPSNLDVRVNFPRASSGGLERLADWFSAHRGGLVVVDTLAKFRDPARGTNTYEQDYAAVGSIKTIADEFDGAALVVTHTRKSPAEDPFDEISGTLGVNGAADSLLVLDRERGTDTAALFLTGRDLAESTLSLSWTPDAGLWSISGRADGIERPDRIGKASKVDKCEQWLKCLLEAFSWPDADLIEAANLSGFTFDNVKEAKAKLRGGEPPLCSKPRGKGGEWWC